jgi:hypothetical protein
MMATAGFWAIESHEIVFGRDGEWYSDGERIANPRISALFSRSVRRREDGGFELRVGDEHAKIRVEDTPFVVRQLEGDPQSGFRITLNDGTTEPLDPATLRVGADNAFVCRVKGGEAEARLLRPAHHALARWVRQDTGGFVLECGNTRHPIAARD